jgi:putative Holliday junction resolvase
MRIIGIDYGDRRTGIAVSDPFGWTAQGLAAIIGNMEDVLLRVASLVDEYSAQTVVLGYPLNMDGSAGSRAERTDLFARKLSERVGGGVGVVKWDERLTTVQAVKSLRELGSKAPRQRAESAETPKARQRGTRAKSHIPEKSKLDIVSAAIILQSYLDSRRQESKDTVTQ